MIGDTIHFEVNPRISALLNFKPNSYNLFYKFPNPFCKRIQT